jgi:hypothetical protein
LFHAIGFFFKHSNDGQKVQLNTDLLKLSTDIYTENDGRLKLNEIRSVIKMGALLIRGEVFLRKGEVWWKGGPGNYFNKSKTFY